jgi:hypothetical protein
MLDLWHTLGTILVFPDDFFSASDALVKQIGGPLFEWVPQVYSEERDANGVALSGPFATFVNKVGGNLDKNITTAARSMLAQYVATHHGELAPPISIYTAGKFCQMLTVPSFDFKNKMNAFVTAFRRAGGTSLSPSRYFLSLAGVSLLDFDLSATLSDASDPDRLGIYKEFRVTDPEKAVMTAFVKDPDFIRAQKLLLDPPDWDSCLEQFSFWAAHNERMVA